MRGIDDLIPCIQSFPACLPIISQVVSLLPRALRVCVKVVERHCFLLWLVLADGGERVLHAVRKAQAVLPLCAQVPPVSPPLPPRQLTKLVWLLRLASTYDTVLLLFMTKVLARAAALAFQGRSKVPPLLMCADVWFAGVVLYRTEKVLVSVL